MAILNGKHIANSEIDPARHRYIGMWRPPVNPLVPASPGHVVDIIICYCGTRLRFVQEGQEHYLRGCCDIPQYVDIKQ